MASPEKVQLMLDRLAEATPEIRMAALAHWPATALSNLLMIAIDAPSPSGPVINAISASLEAKL